MAISAITNSRKSRFFFGLLALSTAVILVVGLNLSALGGNWRWDDSVILLHIVEFELPQTFLLPQVWQELSRTNLMPLLVASFNLDLALFGLEPQLFYAHQLLVILLVAAALYSLLRLYVQKSFAVVGSLLFLIGSPVAIVAQQLMSRHYIEGLLFCLTALICQINYLRRHNLVWLVAGTFLYLLAVLAKEIYVPLVILLLFVPESRFSVRIKGACPHILVALTYVFWRTNMLGSMLGGYTDPAVYFDPAFVPQVMGTFITFPRLLLGEFWLLPTLCYVALITTYGFVCRSWMLFSALVLALVLLPLVPLVQSPGINSPDRYLLLPWCVVIFSLIYCASSLYQRPNIEVALWQRMAIGIVIISVAGVAFSRQREVAANVLETADEYDVLAEFIWAGEESQSFVPGPETNQAFWFITGLRDLKTRWLAGQSSPVPVPDDIFLNATTGVLFEYSKDCRCMLDISETIASRRTALQSSLDAEAELRLQITYEDGQFAWDVGPYQAGNYAFVSQDMGKVPVPPQGQVGATIPDGAALLLRYDSPQGWVTYSSPHQVFRTPTAIAWARP